jgi:UDP-N-acetylglucosamine transferase subunit ALG13
MEKGKSLLVTVGSTNFNSLITQLDQKEFYEILIKAGFT